jgi:hypothetical protein
LRINLHNDCTRIYHSNYINFYNSELEIVDKLKKAIKGRDEVLLAYYSELQKQVHEKDNHIAHLNKQRNETIGNMEQPQQDNTKPPVDAPIQFKLGKL